MLDSLLLNNQNHYYEGEVLLFLVHDQVYRYQLVNYKNYKVGNQVYLYYYQNEFQMIYLGFYDQQVRWLFQQLVQINSVGLKTAQLILENYTYNEMVQLVKTADYDALLRVKGIGKGTTKIIIEHLQKEWFSITYSPREEKLISAVTRLGYSRQIVLNTIKNLDLKQTDEVCLQKLLSSLGNKISGVSK